MVNGALYFMTSWAFWRKIKELLPHQTASFSDGNDEIPPSQPCGFDQTNA
jgi:hypothetical protein